jgi:serine/threonine protein kinase
VQLLQDVTSAVAFMHSKLYMHRDIKVGLFSTYPAPCMPDWSSVLHR